MQCLDKVYLIQGKNYSEIPKFYGQKDWFHFSEGNIYIAISITMFLFWKKKLTKSWKITRMLWSFQVWGQTKGLGIEACKGCKWKDQHQALPSKVSAVHLSLKFWLILRVTPVFMSFFNFTNFLLLLPKPELARSSWKPLFAPACVKLSMCGAVDYKQRFIPDGQDASML